MSLCVYLFKCVYVPIVPMGFVCNLNALPPLFAFMFVVCDGKELVSLLFLLVVVAVLLFAFPLNILLNEEELKYSSLL